MPRDHGIPSVSWWDTTIPTTGPTGTGAIWVGQNVAFDVPGRVAGFRRYKFGPYDGNDCLLFFEDVSRRLCMAYFFKPWVTPGNQWVNTWSHPLVRIDTTISYHVALMFGAGNRFSTPSVLGSPVTHNHIQFIHSWTSTVANPLTASFSYSNNAYGVDVLFIPD